MGADVQRVVVDQLQKVLIQQNHLAALLPRVRLHVPVSQGALQVKHLSHLATIEKILHHEQVQFLLCVVLGVLVTDSVNTQDLRQRSRPFLLHSSGDVGEVVRCKVQEGLDLQSGHLLQDEPVI